MAYRQLLDSQIFRTLAIIVGVCVAFSTAHADSWPKSKHSEINILHSATLSASPKAIVGLHIKMRKGWKTYWRRPGDAGIPPSFDWKGSQNVKLVKVLWPAPKRMKDPYGSSIGYEDEVVFPVLFEAVNPEKPMTVKLAIVYGVCKEVCVPEQKVLSFKVPGGTSNSIKSHKLLSRFYKKVPKPVNIAENSKNLPVVKSVKTITDGKTPHIDLMVSFPQGSVDNDVFIEVSDGFFIVEPKQKTTKPSVDEKLFRVDLTKGDKPSELKGKTITVTLVSNLGYSETKWVVK